MKKQIKRNLSRVLALFVAFVMFTTPAFAAKRVENEATCNREPHQHTDECYETKTVEKKVLDCQNPNHHEHTDACYGEQWELVCTEATPQHTHDESCYKTIDVYTCEEPVHTHGDGCYTLQVSTPEEGAEEDSQADGAENTESATKVLTCTLNEHSHTDTCAKETHKELICNKLDLPAHKHGEGCYKKVLTCGMSAHTDECYKTESQEEKTLICGKEEHQHETSCYSADASHLFAELNAALKAAADATDEEGKKVVLILNGGTMTYTQADVDKYKSANAIALRDGQTLTIENGAVAGGTITTTSNSVRLILVTGGSTLNLTGSTVLTNGHGTGGGAIYAAGENTTVNIRDDVAIRDNHTSASGGGILAEKHATVNMYGGTISDNTANTEEYKGTTPVGQGGGIAVKSGATFNMYDGTISGNQAGEGGGVFIGYDQIDGKGEHIKSTFNMTGGTVDGNTATLGEGGGIYIHGEGTISGGKITNNVTYTYKDLGGGGIYIESDGKLQLTNAVITNNLANGQGGGIAACVHGKNIVYAKDGAAIFGNLALGKGHAEGYPKKDENGNLKKDEDGNQLYNGSFIDGYVLWAGEDIFKDKDGKTFAQDIFIAGDADQVNSQGVAGFIASSEMLGGGDAQWKGYTYCYAVDPKTGELAKDENNHYILELTQVTKDNDDVVFGNRLVFLTAEATPEAIQQAKDAMEKAQNGGVLISGNLSANTHGGGIANNGVLIIGEESDFTNGAKQPEIDANKTLTNSANEEENKSLQGGEFTFDLYQVTTDAEGKETVNKIEGASVKNEEGGNVPNFTFPAEIFKEPGIYTFQVKEDLTGDGGKLEDGSTLKYDKSVYEITIEVTESKQAVKVGDKTINVTTLTVGDPVIKMVVDKDGNKLKTPADATNIAFDNQYTAPEKPKDPPKEDPKDPEDPPKDPEDPPKDPEDPPKDPEDPPEDPEDPPEVPEDPEYPPYTPEEPPYSPEYPPYTPEEPVTPPAAPVTPPTIDVPTPPVPQAELPEVPEEPEEPMEEVEEPEVPLVEEPEEEEEEEPEEEEFVEIEDPDVPLASVPVTGDNSYIWTIMTLVSGLALVCLTLIKKREDKAE